MRTAVTGGAGFIGSHLCGALADRGHTLLVVDDLSHGRRENLDGVEHRLVEADIRSREAAEQVAEFAPQALYHLAAQMDVRKSVADPGFDAEVNLVGWIRMLEAARRGGQLEQIVFAGSGGAMYGEQDHHPAPEDHPVRPTSPYGLAKSVGEQYLELFGRMYGVRGCALRYSNVYGPRQDGAGEAGVVAIFCERILRGKGLTIYGDGSQTRDFIHVRDVVEANLVALEQRLSGPYNVGTGIETSVNELARLLTEIAASDVPVEYERARLGEQQRSSIDPARLEAASGFRPRIELREGLRETYDWFGG